MTSTLAVCHVLHFAVGEEGDRICDRDVDHRLFLAVIAGLISGFPLGFLIAVPEAGQEGSLPNLSCRL